MKSVQTQQVSRVAKGLCIGSSQIVRLGEGSFLVASQSRPIVYQVRNGSAGWTCTCPDHVYRGVACKHILAVQAQ